MAKYLMICRRLSLIALFVSCAFCYPFWHEEPMVATFSHIKVTRK